MSKEYITNKLSVEVEDALDRLDKPTLDRLSTVMRRPNLRIRMNRELAPYGVTISTPYGTIQLDDTLTNIDKVYVNGTQFTVKENGIDAIEKLVNGVDSAKEVLGDTVGRQKRGRRVRKSRRRDTNDMSQDEIREIVEQDLKGAEIRYDNLFTELNGLMMDSNITSKDIVDELFAYNVAEEDIPHFLAHESKFSSEIIAKVFNTQIETIQETYNFEPVKADDSFLGRLMTSLDVEEAEYDSENGVLKIGDRLIKNLPNVDENGVFSNGDKRYIPYHVGYFADGDGTRVERLRTIDPVQVALDSVKLQYDLTQGDIKFQTILDVTRNLPDFDKHPYGDEILDTFKRKIVLDKSYLSTNSLLNEYRNKADDLGAVATMMLDENAEGLIDPLGTSNGGNMGAIFYLTSDAVINDDGSITRGTEKYSKVGQVMADRHILTDNFNRNQMSFNAFLTSVDVQTLKVAYAELGLWNSEDAVALMKKGSDAFPNAGQKAVGDKLEDFHGDKSTVSIVIDPDMDPEEAKAQELEYAVKFADLNRDLDMVVSPISVASRLNMGIPHEGLAGEKQDLHLPNGDVVKDGIVEMTYMSLPQTAEHKSKDYGVEGEGRRYSTLFRYALASKVGLEAYEDAFIDEDVRQANMDKAVTSFQRLGVTFVDEEKLVTTGNIKEVVDAYETVDVTDMFGLTPSIMRKALQEQMKDNNTTSINIDLGDKQVISPLTGEPIKDSLGRNVLPIRVTENGTIPFRYSELFKDLSWGNTDKLQRHFDHAVGNDYSILTRKNNILKNIDTMVVTEGAHTDVIVPDPRLGLGEVRVNLEDTRVVAHRDPAIKSGNTISFNNVKGGEPNVMHMNPLIAPQQDKDYDGDTEGVSEYEQLGLTEEQKDKFFADSSVEEQLNHYGEVYLSTGGGHFKALALANGIDTSDITFDDGKSNAELARIVEEKTHQILNSPDSYGAYALSFTDEKSVLESLGRLADDGIKGDRESMEHHFKNGYTPDENRAVMKALIAKSEWTGLAGSVTNNLIAALGDQGFDKDLIRTAMDITHTQTQSVLQMKKNADKLPVIDEGIRQMKAVFSGKYDVEKSREILKNVTKDLIPEKAVDQFVDQVAAKQESNAKFGRGVLNNTDMSTAKLSYVTGANFGKALKNISNSSIGVDDDFAKILMSIDADSVMANSAK